MIGPAMAVDCDLGRIHCWCSQHGEICRHSKTLVPVINHACLLHPHPGPTRDLVSPTVLFEIASPVSGMRESGNAVLYHLTKWIIWNVAHATELSRRLPGVHVLVSPSNVWTRGHDVKVRHRLCAATATLKDLRECEAMLFSFEQMPELWGPLDVYLGQLIAPKDP